MKYSRLKTMFKQLKKNLKQLQDQSGDSRLKSSYKELKKAYRSLDEYKDALENKVQQEMQKRMEQEIMLLQKVRFITMGEMMDAVAHQWTQPITLISMYVDEMKYSVLEDKIDNRSFIDYLESIERQKEHMESTLKEFRDFLNPINENAEFNLNTALKRSLKLLEEELKYTNIEIEFKENETEIVLHGNEKEIEHVIINILNNAKDAFEIRKIEKRKIALSFLFEESKVILEIQDNAVGIEETLLEKLFNPYVTSKKNFGGSGIGLYLCKLIMEKHHAQIKVENSQEGAKFTLHFNRFHKKEKL